jgi:hypothetical protein
VAPGDALRGSPTSGPESIPAREWRMAAIFAACGLVPACAYGWATPGDAQSLGSLLVTFPLIAAFFVVEVWRGYLDYYYPRKKTLIILTWGRCLRALLPCLLVCLLIALAEAVPAVAAAAGEWPGGWALGLAGAVVGALLSAACGKLLLRPLFAARDAGG